MALQICAPSLPFSFANNLSALRRITPSRSAGYRCLPLRVRCSAAAGEAPSRRTANYQPNLWTDDFIQSLTSTYVEEDNVRRTSKLKEDVQKVIYTKKELKEQLQLIDQLQQLGIAYHFKDDIKDSLWNIYGTLEDIGILLEDNLHATSLLFRLLRENGFDVSEDMFNIFRDEKGHFKSCLQHQTEGLLSLYEASYIEKEREHALDEAMDFTTKHLKHRLMEGSLEPHLRERVAHALELPLNWRMQRLHTRWFIEACQKEDTINPALLEFARLDFNVVQSIYKRELREVSRWWTDLGLAQRLPFFRDRLTENYLWSVGWAFEPEYWSYREIQTKANCFITMIDDVYDVYGTLDELEQFTDAVDRWDVNAIDKLPEYMKMCFLAVFNTANDAGYKIMKEKGLDAIPYLKRQWVDLCKTYLVEAKWYHQGYKPKLDEYLDNAWISISGHIPLTHAYCMSKDLTKEALENFSSYPEIARPSCMLLRLYDDLATSTVELQRGDVPKSIQCCMYERDVSEAAAREQIREMVRVNWRALNGDRAFSSSFDENFKSVAINIPRMAQFIYQDGVDGYGIADGETKKQVLSLLIEPIKL